MSRKKYDLVATIGEYKDHNTGEMKKRRINVGAVFEDEQGRLSGKLDSVPVGANWSGWFLFFEPRREDRESETPY